MKHLFFLIALLFCMNLLQAQNNTKQETPARQIELTAPIDIYEGKLNPHMVVKVIATYEITNDEHPLIVDVKPDPMAYSENSYNGTKFKGRCIARKGQDNASLDIICSGTFEYYYNRDIPMTIVENFYSQKTFSITELAEMKQNITKEEYGSFPYHTTK